MRNSKPSIGAGRQSIFCGELSTLIPQENGGLIDVTISNGLAYSSLFKSTISVSHFRTIGTGLDGGKLSFSSAEGFVDEGFVGLRGHP